MNGQFDFSRQMKVAGVGEAGQKALQRARVLVAGAGGLGATAIPYLAAAGVGQLTIVDDDRIEMSNLHRQIPFTARDVGQLKAPCAAQFARERSANAEIVAIARRLTGEEWLAAVEAHDVIVDCTDDRHLAYLLSDAGLVAQKPVVFANAAALNGQLFVHLGGENSPCWRCLWPEEMPAAGNCQVLGVVGVVPATLGCWQALMVLKILWGMPVAGEALLFYDFASMRQQTITVTKNAHCDHQISAATFLQRHGLVFVYPHSIAEAQGAGLVVIDIRRAEEWQAHPFPWADLCIEMQSLRAKPAYYLHPQQRYLLVCASGQRAKESAYQLQKQGFSNVFAFPRGG